MRREVTIAVPKCLNDYCPRISEPGQFGYCSKCGQSVRRRLKARMYEKEDLVARGKLLLPSIDRFLRKG